VAQRFAVGDAVQTPFGKGSVRATRNNGRVLVYVGGRALVVHEADVSALDGRKGKVRSAAVPVANKPHCPSSDGRPSHNAHVDGDLHRLTVEQALGRAERAPNEAMLAEVARLKRCAVC